METQSPKSKSRPNTPKKHISPQGSRISSASTSSRIEKRDSKPAQETENVTNQQKLHLKTDDVEVLQNSCLNAKTFEDQNNNSSSQDLKTDTQVIGDNKLITPESSEDQESLKYLLKQLPDLEDENKSDSLVIVKPGKTSQSKDHKCNKKKKSDQGDVIEKENLDTKETQVKLPKNSGKTVLQKCLNQGLKQITPNTPKRRKKIKFMDWKRYHRLNVIYAFLDDLERDYPAICTVSTIGKSVEGRDIKMLKISNSDANNSAVWLDGSIHSREWISTAVVTYIADDIVKNFNEQPNSVTNKDWHIVPVVNPDGYEYSHTHDRMWRKNCAKIGGEKIGVDLNRNFSYGWGYHGDQGSSDQPRNVFYRGPQPFSEPETMAIRDTILQSSTDFKVFLSFHSYFQLIIFPWGHKAEPCPAYLKLLEGGLEMARAIQECYGLTYKVGCTKDLTYCACGTSIDWSFAIPKIPYSYMIELRSRKHKFKLPREQILPNSIEVWAGVKRLMEYVDANELDVQIIDSTAATLD